MFELPAILCNNEHRFLVAEQLQELGLELAKIILEPCGRNTAPAGLIAALAARQNNVTGDPLVLLMPSDQVMADEAGFRASVEKGIESASAGHIVTFGVRPDAPETGYGYIETTKAHSTVLDVLRFVEKPDRQTAEEYLCDGNFLWNAGIFLYSAVAMITAFEVHEPEMLGHCREALKRARTDLDFLRLDGEFYEKCKNISLDYAIMEKVSGIKCVPLDTDWSDLGSWSALWEITEKDEDGNATLGDVLLQDTRNSYVHSRDGACVALVGMADVVVVATRDAVLVAQKNRVQDVEKIVDKLKQDGRDEYIYHTRVYRPWGWYEGLSEGHRFQVKCLFVKPGAQLSLQSHQHRAEHWVVVSGTARVIVGEKTFRGYAVDARAY